jgi:hypothetical protein
MSRFFLNNSTAFTGMILLSNGRSSYDLADPLLDFE